MTLVLGTVCKTAAWAIGVVLDAALRAIVLLLANEIKGMAIITSMSAPVETFFCLAENLDIAIGVKNTADQRGSFGILLNNS